MSVEWRLRCCWPLRDGEGLCLKTLHWAYHDYHEKRLPLPEPLQPIVHLHENDLGFCDYNHRVTGPFFSTPYRIRGEWVRLIDLVMREHPWASFDFYDVRSSWLKWAEVDHSRYEAEKIKVMEELVRVGYGVHLRGELVIAGPWGDSENVGIARCRSAEGVLASIDALLETIEKYDAELSDPANHEWGEWSLKHIVWPELNTPKYPEGSCFALAARIELAPLIHVCRTAKRYGWLLYGSLY